MYACSTTTYQGFQAIMTEQESEKFKGMVVTNNVLCCFPLNLTFVTKKLTPLLYVCNRSTRSGFHIARFLH